ncbi:MAG: HYR domain-containing protein [Chitinophagaceae bacterium]|nr:MAG: HYR domain-containing protein [Chitinophagaceae bacterium]
MSQNTSPGSKNRRILHRSRLLVCTLLLLFIATAADASHFRYGNISWSWVSGRTVQFKVSQAYRRSFSAAYTNAVPGTSINVGSLTYSDNSTSSAINLVITSVNVAEDWIYGEATITKTFNTDGTFTAAFSSNARLSTLKNNADLSYRQEARVTIGGAAAGNSGPASGMPPTVNLPFGRTAATFQLAATDPNGDLLTYRFATAAEMGGGVQPNTMTLNSTGRVTFNTTVTPGTTGNPNMAVNNLYSAVFIVTDSKGATTMIDLMVKIVQASTPPAFNYTTTPASGTVYDIQPGQNVSFTVSASDIDPGDQVASLVAVGLPTGVSLTPALPTSGNPATVAFSWTPTAAQLGTRVISFTAQDNSGNQSTTTVTIIVGTNPVFNVPPTPVAGWTEVVVPGATYTTPVSVTAPDPTVNVQIVSASIPAGASFSPALPSASGNTSVAYFSWTPALANWGKHPLVFTAMDNLGKSKNHSMNILVNTTPWFVSANPGSVTIVENQPFSYAITVADPDLAYGDVMQIIAMNLPSWMSFTQTGTTTGVLSGTPPVGSAGSSALSVIAEDKYHHDHPEIRQDFTITVNPCNVQTSIQASALSSCPGSPITLTASGANTYAWSNGATGTSIQVAQSGTYSAIGSTNGCNGTSNAITVTIADNEAPVPMNASLETLRGECSVTAVAPTANDNCSGIVTATTTDATTFSQQGNYTINWTYSDANGNSSTQTQTVIVRDMTAPVIACPFNITVNADGNSCGAVVHYNAPSATDNCGNGSLPTSIPGYSYQGTFNGHTYFLSNDATSPEDAHARAIALGGHLVTISNASENAFVSAMSPSFIWIGHTDRENEGEFRWVTSEPVSYTNWNGGEPNNWGGNEDWAVINWGPNGTWNDWLYYENALFVVEFEGGNIPTTLVSGLGSGATFPIGTSTETWEAVDAGGNRAVCSFVVTVIDSEAPSITGMPSDITVMNDANVCGAAVNWTAPSSADNCTGHSIALIDGPAPGSVFPVGTTVVTYRATDAAGLTSDGSFLVTVIDNERPTFVNMPVDIVVSNEPGICGARVTWTPPTSADNCSMHYVMQIDGQPNGSIFPVGHSTVTYGVRDAAGNFDMRSFSVVVEDREAPVLSGVPASETVECNAVPAAASVAATDNCAFNGQVQYREERVDGSCPSSYTLTRTWTATDAAGNSSTAAQVITVQDTAAPSLAVSNITVENNAGECGAVVAFAATASDNCGDVSLSYSQQPGTFFPVGTTVVSVTATDACGNSTNSNFSITVTDTERPVVRTQALTIQLDAAGAAAINAQQVNNGSSDNCAIASLSLDKTGFDCSNVGTNTVILTVVDVHGNVQSAPATITVEDHVAPVISCPASVTLNCQDDHSTASTGIATATDACGVASIVSNDASTQSSDVNNAAHYNYTITRTWTATDKNGNQSSCAQIITVQDVTAPVVATMASALDRTVECSDAAGIASALALAPSATDNCAPVSMHLVIDETTAGCGSTYTRVRQWNFTDVSGNRSARFTQTLTVLDRTAPVVTSNFGAVELCFDSTSSHYNVAPVAGTDNCTAVAYTYVVKGSNGQTLRTGATANASGTFAVGMNTITWTLKDVCGNATQATATVRINAPISGSFNNFTLSGGKANTIYTSEYAPAASATISVTATGGTAPYTYSWSKTGAAANFTAGANPASITATAVSSGMVTFTVIVTDSKGCKAIFRKTINVVDARCGNKMDKVLVCHGTGSASNPWVQICVSANAVPAQLGNGSYLGACNSSAVTRTQVKAEPTIEASLSAFPNPSRGTVHLRVNGLQGQLRIEVLDARGSSLLQRNQNVTYKTEDITLDLHTAAAGMYTVRVSNGATVLSTRIVIAR